MPYTSLQHRAVAGHIAAWNLIVEAYGSKPAERAGWAIACTGAPFKAVNHVISPVDPSASDAAAIVEDARDRASSFVVQLWGEAGKDVRDALLAQGLTHTVEFPLMVRSTRDLPAHDVPGLRVERVESPDDIAVINDVSSEVFGSPRAMGDVLSPRVAVESPDCAYFLARLDGEPVGTSIGIVSGDVTGVYAVTTVEAARRRGVGAAVTWAVLAHGASRGADVAYLQSSPMGFSVYERMGFEVVGRHALYETES